MAEEEDEVDILGDFNLDNLLHKEDGRLDYVSGVLGSQGAELLNCDYNLGSNWLLDTSNQSCWNSASGDDPKSYERQQYAFTSTLGNGSSESLPSTSQWDEAVTWTDKEKSSLERGLDLFGPNWSRLAQFIGTKNSQQVKYYLTLKNQKPNLTQNFTLETNHCNSEEFNFSELIDDMQIPASMEEVIAVVSTAQPTVPAFHRRNTSSFISNSVKEPGKKKTRHDGNRKTKGRRVQSQILKSLCAKRGSKLASCYLKKSKLEQNTNPLVVSSGEEVIRIKKESSQDSDQDEEIEIEDEEDTFVRKYIPSKVPDVTSDIKSEVCTEPTPLSDVEQEDSKNEFSEVEKETCANAQVQDENSRGHSHHDVLETIFNLPPPTKEITLNPEVVTEQERAIHVEFFEGRSAKTPKRYLKIRNHILECWRLNRPLYVTKTSVRTGLKHCGDVNCIGLIHAYLEQIGAINFGCEQARYVSGSGLSIPVAPTRKKLTKDQLTVLQQARIDAMRPRKKKQSTTFKFDGDGGYTITHSETGEAIHTTVVQDSISRGSRSHSTKTDPIKLIYCNQYSKSKPAMFFVEISIEALLVMDLHAHSSHTEVAGLLGGHYNAESGLLHIERALACRSSSSGVHCDMCPVSQTEASEKLQGDGLEVVGWYHSHPTFLPNPSLQDLATQSSIQQWFAQTTASPIVSFILTPFCPTNPTLASQFRCLTVHTDDLSGSSFGTPYSCPLSVTSHGLNVASMLKDMAAIFSLIEENQQVAVDFDADFHQYSATTYKQKCVESAKLHLASSSPKVSMALQNTVVQGVVQACSTLILARYNRN